MLSTISLDSLFLSLFNSNPAALKILSEGTDVAGTASTFLATHAILGKQLSLFFHHSSGLALESIFSLK